MIPEAPAAAGGPPRLCRGLCCPRLARRPSLRPAAAGEAGSPDRVGPRAAQQPTELSRGHQRSPLWAPQVPVSAAPERLVSRGGSGLLRAQPCTCFPLWVPADLVSSPAPLPSSFSPHLVSPHPWPCAQEARASWGEGLKSSLLCAFRAQPQMPPYFLQWPHRHCLREGSPRAVCEEDGASAGEDQSVQGVPGGGGSGPDRKMAPVGAQ